MENNPQPLIMDEPKAAANEPVCVAVAANRNFSWCTCGLSEKQPFCDGRHKQIDGMPFKSLRHSFAQEEEVWYCMCKQTKTPPFCDGSHKNRGRE
jgi:CDGSH-type Zn-finger protein